MARSIDTVMADIRRQRAYQKDYQERAQDKAKALVLLEAELTVLKQLQAAESWPRFAELARRNPERARFGF